MSTILPLNDHDDFVIGSDAVVYRAAMEQRRHSAAGLESLGFRADGPRILDVRHVLRALTIGRIVPRCRSVLRAATFKKIVGRGAGVIFLAAHSAPRRETQ